MANEKRLIDANALSDKVDESKNNNPHSTGMVRVNHRNEHDHFLRMILDAPTVDAYTEEEVANIIQLAHQLHATNVELEKECAWLKSCLNCKIRKECPRHCGKVVHDCDHWEHGDSTVDAVEVVRCKDCKHRKRPLFAGNDIYCDEQRRHSKLDDFCSYGERREGE